jgi:hypothetical protein
MHEQSEREQAWERAKSALKDAYPQATLTAFVREEHAEENKQYVFRASFDNGTAFNVRVQRAVNGWWYPHPLSIDDIR